MGTTSRVDGRSPTMGDAFGRRDGRVDVAASDDEDREAASETRQVARTDSVDARPVACDVANGVNGWKHEASRHGSSENEIDERHMNLDCLVAPGLLRFLVLRPPHFPLASSSSTMPSSSSSIEGVNRWRRSRSMKVSRG
jgi:hypothetical protein